MKISQEYPNLAKAIVFVASEKGESKVSDDSIKFAFQVPLRNFNKGFDFYEITRENNGGVYYSIVTMLGFKTICQTNSKVYSFDKSVNEFANDIMDINYKHFQKEEYLALKKGYVKKNNSGCLSSAILLLIVGLITISIL